MPRRWYVPIQGESIALGALLKWAGIVNTGGEAKMLIADGRVLVNGHVEKRRGRKIRAGDHVTVQGGPALIVIEGKRGVPPAVGAC